MSRHVERYANKPISDGLSIDDEDNIYVTAIEHSAIARIDAKTRDTRLVAQDPLRMRWPNGLSFGPSQYLYWTNSALHYHFGGALIHEYAPFYILRVKVPTGARPGQ